MVIESSGFGECEQGPFLNCRSTLTYYCDNDYAGKGPSCVEAFNCLETAMKESTLTYYCDNDYAEKGPSCEEAFNCLETAMKELEQQNECVAVRFLPLKLVRDLLEKTKSEAKGNFGFLFLNCRPNLMSYFT
ncbi:hypothetical protein AVEN_112084-1 [Araneus ventricosus]|uniref:Uncharacterized protein n=1 Tax=Araneus ventricosus TaxID=182803 RepID=A0A4Y2NDH8_ARAVE|nr:hypothetical protein AVEN_112084-1 [Araneus ventricosus]